MPSCAHDPRSLIPTLFVLDSVCDNGKTYDLEVLVRMTPTQMRRIVRVPGRPVIGHIEDDRPEPQSIRSLAREHGVPEWAVREALRMAHEDASPSEVIAAAHRIAELAQR